MLLYQLIPNISTLLYRQQYACIGAIESLDSIPISYPGVSFLQIYTNGYVTFGLNFESRYPDNLNKDLLSYAKRDTAKKQGFAMLAPLWTDNDAQYGDIFYHVYDLTQPGSTSTDQARVKVN